ncbi:MAG TPA: hypothetical protein VGJ81_12505 [Thermoanaerobaculia bacterium]
MFRIDYELRGTGWAYLTVTHDDVTRRMEVSYIGPDILDLVWRTAQLLDGMPLITVEFETEPGEHLWTMRREGEAVHLTIESSVSHMIDAEADTWEDEAWSLTATVPLTVLAQAVLAAFDTVMDTIGVAGYEKHWVHPFSGTASADAIRAWLAR